MNEWTLWGIVLGAGMGMSLAQFGSTGETIFVVASLVLLVIASVIRFNKWRANHEH